MENNTSIFMFIVCVQVILGLLATCMQLLHYEYNISLSLTNDGMPVL